MKRFVVWIAVPVLLHSLTACQVVSEVLPQKDPNPPKALKTLQNNLAVTTLWHINTKQSSEKDYVRLHPFVTDNAVIVAGSNAVSAYHKTHGSLLWKTPIKEEITGGVNGGEGLIFIGTSQGNAAALDATNGQIRWVTNLKSEVLAISTAQQGRVAFRTGDGTLSGLATATGEVMWQQQRKTPTLSLRGASEPVVIDKTLVAGFDTGSVAAFDLENGTGLWEAMLALPQSGEASQLSDVDGQMKVVGSALFASSYNGQIAGIRLQDGTIAWSQPYSSYSGLDADTNGLYATSKLGNVWKLDPQTGQAIWKMDDLERREPTAPTLQGDYLVLGDRDGYLHWVNTQNGNMVARLRSDPAGYTVAPVNVNQVVYTFGKSGVLAAYRLP